MAQIRKFGKPTTLRLSLIKNQATELLWNGKVETTLVRAKSVQAYAEKLLTLAVRTYEDNVTVVKEVYNDKGAKVKKEVKNDGPKKLAARRKIMAKLNDVQEQRAYKEKRSDFTAKTKDIAHPLIEKIFNVYAPKYAKREQELKQGGGYTRIIRKDIRRGDNAEVVVLELI